jgi:predicted DNA-binding transcriptional regulator AlpA
MVIPGQTAFSWSATGAEQRDVPRQSVAVSSAPAAEPRPEPPRVGPQSPPPHAPSSPHDAVAMCSLAPVALPPETELWDITHAAQFLKMSTSWVYKRVERGDLPCKRIHGWALRFVPADLRAWAEEQGSKRRARRTTTER